MGRDLQKEYDQEPQVVITLPLLEGTDGHDKMSKSYGNDIGLTDTPEDMYGKSMSITDEMILKYFTLAADADDVFLDQVEKDLNDSSYNPRDAKRLLGRTLVALYYNEDAALKAEQHFDQVIVNKDNPDDMTEFNLDRDMNIIEVLHTSSLVDSKSEARRLFNQGAIRIDGEKIEDMNTMLSKGTEYIIKVGKRRFLKVK